jgi:endonuclease-3
MARKPKKTGGTKSSRAEIALRVRTIVIRLAEEYGGATCALIHRNPFELLVATILSAQCTDARVNLVTPELFARYSSAASLALADREQLEQLIRSTGFFRNKAKSLMGMASAVVDRHGGEIPADLDALTALPGVGRKTAQVVLGTAFGKATGVVVDTHVGRLSRRLGLTKQNDPVKVERDLMAVIPQDEWIDWSHRLIHHGRAVCLARKPKCDACCLADVCPKFGVGVAKRSRTHTTGAGGSSRRG